jgi:hypothetical protein
MMKRRLLMPLIVAGMMVASVVMLEACKKDEVSKVEIKPQTQETIVLTEPVGRADARQFTFCPYCFDTVWENVLTHWHTFGVKGDTIGDYPAFNACAPGIGTYNPNTGQYIGCKYSGDWYNMGPQYHNDTFVARYHGHRIVLITDTEGTGEDEGYANSWHVGGGVPGWWPLPNP